MFFEQLKEPKGTIRKYKKIKGIKISEKETNQGPIKGIKRE